MVSLEDLKKLEAEGKLQGIFPGLPNQEVYQKAPGFSNGALIAFSETPAHLQAYYRRERHETAAQRIGNICHIAILEAERFEKRVAVVEGNRNTNAVKEKIALCEAQGMYVVKQDEYDTARHVRDNALKNKDVAAILGHKDFQSEVSVFAKDPQHGFTRKCRPDGLLIAADPFVILDVKTFDDLSESAIRRQIHRMKYHWQANWYLDTVGIALSRKSNLFMNVFVMVDDPWLVRPVFLDDASLEKAAYEYEPLLEKYAECLKTNIWPGYEDPAPLTTALPEFAWA